VRIVPRWPPPPIPKTAVSSVEQWLKAVLKHGRAPAMMPSWIGSWPSGDLRAFWVDGAVSRS
jgi:hypothetical protein